MYHSSMAPCCFCPANHYALCCVPCLQVREGKREAYLLHRLEVAAADKVAQHNQRKTALEKERHMAAQHLQHAQQAALVAAGASAAHGAQPWTAGASLLRQLSGGGAGCQARAGVGSDGGAATTGRQAATRSVARANVAATVASANARVQSPQGLDILEMYLASRQGFTVDAGRAREAAQKLGPEQQPRQPPAGGGLPRLGKGRPTWQQRQQAALALHLGAVHQAVQTQQATFGRAMHPLEAAQLASHERRPGERHQHVSGASPAEATRLPPVASASATKPFNLSGRGRPDAVAADGSAQVGDDTEAAAAEDRREQALATDRRAVAQLHAEAVAPLTPTHRIGSVAASTAGACLAGMAVGQAGAPAKAPACGGAALAGEPLPAGLSHQELQGLLQREAEHQVLEIATAAFAGQAESSLGVEEEMPVGELERAMQAVAAGHLAQLGRLSAGEDTGHTLVEDPAQMVNLCIDGGSALLAQSTAALCPATAVVEFEGAFLRQWISPEGELAGEQLAELMGALVQEHLMAMAAAVRS